MSNYFPNARPLQSTLSTLSLLDPTNYNCIGIFLINSSSTVNLKDELITQYINDSSNFPGYENLKSFKAALNKVEATFITSGKYSFKSLTLLETAPPSTGITFYGNSNFQNLSINGTIPATIVLYTKE